LRAQLEVAVADLEAEVERVAGLGATRHSHQDPDDPTSWSCSTSTAAIWPFGSPSQ